MVDRMGPDLGKVLILIVAAVIGLVVANGVMASTPCKKVNGKLTLQTITGPACSSPIGLCATGTFSGDLKGTLNFTGTSLVPTVDTPTTAVVLVTGDNVIETGDGTLMTKDAIVLRTAGAGDFAEVDTVVGGTGSWAGASGVIRALGIFGAAGGEGEYIGEICTG